MMVMNLLKAADSLDVCVPYNSFSAILYVYHKHVFKSFSL